MMEDERTGCPRGVTVEMAAGFDDTEIREAELRLQAALGAADRTAWVFHYTSDAIFDGGGEYAVVGRDSLLAMATSMRPLTDVSIRPLRTEGSGSLAAVWTEASWVNGAAEGDPMSVEVRAMILWRREADGVWRVAMEHIS